VPVERIWRDALAVYRTGLHPALGLNIRHRGKVILDRTVGHVEHEPGQEPGPEVTPDTLFNLFSASKILTTVLVHAAVEDGLIKLSNPVAHYLPGFERHGKGNILVRHLLNHTAGIPNMPRGVDVFEQLKRGSFNVELLYDLKPKNRPGRVTGYHPINAFILLGEIVERVTGKDLRTFAHDRILGPLGIKHFNYGVAPEDISKVAKHAYTGPRTPSMVEGIFSRTVGANLKTAIEISNHPNFLTGIMPAANVVGTGRDTTLFLQMLLNKGELNGVRVLKQSTIHRMTHDVTKVQLDSTFGFPMRYGLGVMMGGGRFSLFGLGTRGAYGHLGFTNVVVYADPSRDLAVSFLNTGKPMLAPGMFVWYYALQRIALMVPRS